MTLTKQLTINSIVLFTILNSLACKKFVEIAPPVTRLVTASVFTSDAAANSAMTAVYGEVMNNINSLGSGNFTIIAGLAADELQNYSTNTAQAEFFKNSLNAANSINQGFWNEGFNRIYAVNAIIEGLHNSTGISNSAKQEIEGEAKLVRAFFNFMLVNMYGDIPAVTTTDYQINSSIIRSPTATIYQNIIADLKEAQILLPADYSIGQGERIRPNKWAASALLARVYLYTGDWTNAIVQSSSLIANSSLFQLENDLNRVFLKNTSEAIWQLKPVRTNVNTNEGQAFILTSTPNNCALSNYILSGFENGDYRKAKWTNNLVVGLNTYWYPYKYKIKSASALTEYYIILRLAEQYLIRSEALLHQNDITGAISDLNTIRSRAGLPPLPLTLSKDSCIKAIEQERRVELFCEWGHRWFDLKRTGRADAILAAIKGSNWQVTDKLFPIPQSQLLNDPNTTQNPGY